MNSELHGQQIDEVLDAAQRLLSAKGAADRLKSLPIAMSDARQDGWVFVALPDWASDLMPADKDGLLVPNWGGCNANWTDYDWWRGAHAMLMCDFERVHETSHGPIHSYSSRLGAELQPVFDHAWVNRIILFLRRWWANQHDKDEAKAFGALPAPILYLTHDVDAVAKTLPIRLKQAAFCSYNRQFGKAIRFMFGLADYWQFDRITQMEHSHNRRSLWNVYGGGGGWFRSPMEILLDPSYDVMRPRIVKQLRELVEKGHKIGLHPKFDSWENPERMAQEKTYIENAIGTKISNVRQHWLRFSFEQTWSAQAKAGLGHDMTLGFNDRSGFRSAAAFSFTDSFSNMQVTPMVLMDSHLYDYAVMSEQDRHDAIDRILLELKQTGGEASAIWHQRVFHPDYGWDGGYAYLLKRMDELGFES